jgi:effector-binding domain-containing protein
MFRIGEFSKIAQVPGSLLRYYDEIGLWVEENGYRISGPGREALIQPPRAERLDEMVTEIQFPVEHRDNTAST